jgi:hypothetical protein
MVPLVLHLPNKNRHLAIWKKKLIGKLKICIELIVKIHHSQRACYMTILVGVSTPGGPWTDE